MPRKTVKKDAKSHELTKGNQVAIYARVSSKDQEKEGFSIPAQLKLLRDYGHSLDFKIAGEFVDVETAKTSGRVAFGQMVKFLEKNPSVKHLLVEKTDRLYRNLKDRVLIDELGCVLHLVKEGQVLSRDSRSSEKFIHDIKLLVAKNYIDNLSEEVRKGMTEKAEQGIWPSYAPIGYMNVKLLSGKNGIVLDQSRAIIIRRLFDMYATKDFSLKELTQWARSVGLTFRKSAKPLNKATIHGILHNRIYTGDFEFKGNLYKGIHEPIISRELWDQVQSVFEGKYSNGYRVIKHDLPFSGLIRCGHCGCAVVGDIKKKKYVYYRCTRQRGRCPEKYARQEVIETHLTEAINRIILPKPFVQWAGDVLVASKAADARLHEASIARLTMERDQIQKRLDAIYIDKLDGRITSEMYDRHSDEWRPEFERLERWIEEHRAGNESYLLEGARLLELMAKLPKIFKKQPAHEKRRLLNFVVSNSTWKEGKLTVTYRQPFDLFATWEESMKKAPVSEGVQNGQNEIWLLR
jgi:site-specific DNA recombinase